MNEVQREVAMRDASGASRMERKREYTRQNIIMAALGLFRTQGIDATTMEQIAEEVDIAKGTLYHYFPVKEAIISEYIQQVSEENNVERIQRLINLPDTRSRMQLALTEMMLGVETQKELFEKYFVYRIQQMISLHRNANGESGLHLLESEIIRLGQENGEIRRDVPLEILEGFFEFVFIVITQQYYKDPERFDAEGTIGRCVELFLNGAHRPAL